MRWLVCLWLALTLCASGCSKDFQSIGDKHVEDDILAKQEKQEAIPFFAAKGRLYDLDSTTQVDKEVVVPMLEQLQSIAPTEQWAIRDSNTQNTAVALLIKLPGDMATVDEMAAVVQQADDKFSGFILQQWGHEWLLMNLIPKEAYDFLKKNDPNIDVQR